MDGFVNIEGSEFEIITNGEEIKGIDIKSNPLISKASINTNRAPIFLSKMAYESQVKYIKDKIKELGLSEDSFNVPYDEYVRIYKENLNKYM